MTTAERILDCRGRPLVLGGGTRLMGILNVTPDSFYDGGRYADPAAALAQAGRLAAEGADLIDVGAQSTRPGHRAIEPAEEIERLRPLLERLPSTVSVPISVDTYVPAVASAALEAGVHVLNDVRGFQGDPAMARVAAKHSCPVILMHWEEGFAEVSGDTLGRIKRYFERSLGIAGEAGVDPGRILLDPGVGFAKTPAQSLETLARLGELRGLGFPVVLGASRKSVIGHASGGEPADRLEGTLATTVLAVAQGVEIVRVHDVAANRRAIRTAEAILQFRR